MAAKHATIDDLDGQAFDFIIIGGGTSGCLIAARLATGLPSSRVLLIEAGGDVQQEDLIPGLTKPRFGSAEGNWLYQTVPQRELNGRIIPYPRGRGLGGCSGNNFMAWVRGPSVDYDDWADAVDDDWWKWDKVLPFLKKLENFRPSIPQGKECYAKPTAGAHGTEGPFAVTYGTEWQALIEYCMLAGQEAGHKVNLDNNDGNPEGISIAQFNVDSGARVTSTTAFLDLNTRARLENLVILRETLVTKLILRNKQVVGIEVLPTVKAGEDFPVLIHAKKEVVLTAGCFQTPQLLLLSGIGPAKDCTAHGIPMIHDLPAVGRNLQDHSALACEFIVKPSILGHNQILNDPSALAKATDEYKLTKSGPLATFGASASIIFPKLPNLLKSSEFEGLPSSTKDFLKAENRPSTEIWMHSGPLFYTGPCPQDASVLVIEGLCQNNLSRGSLKLASSNPRDFPTIDPGYLSHLFDTKIAVETLREIIRLAQTPTFSSIIDSILLGPRLPIDSSKLASFSGSDDKVLEDFVRENLTQGFHAMSTCVMGKPSDLNKVVGSDFRVDGVKGLRIADMSVCPILTSNHTQINAYLIGERCAELILRSAGSSKGPTGHLETCML